MKSSKRTARADRRNHPKARGEEPVAVNYARIFDAASENPDPRDRFVSSYQIHER